MSKAVAAYLGKRSVHREWPLLPADLDAGGLQQVVVIPVLAESADLFDTLRDLDANPAAQRRHTLVLCVVNNRAPEMAGAADIADNQRTLAALPEFQTAHPGLRLAWIDASSPGRELGPKEGVGLARKIGLDWALALLAEAGRPNGTLICLDADTRVAPNYLETVHAFYASNDRWAAVVDYAHPVDGDAAGARAILSYELFLRYQELAWHYAGSPYAYPAIGSTMSCTGVACAAAGGMNRRRAGEDFYFLQQLAKTGTVQRIWGTTVVPSRRPSHRVPFGTGRKIGAFPEDEGDAYLTYHPATYRVIRAWLDMATAHPNDSGAALLERAAAIDDGLADYLAGQRFVTAWDRITAQARDIGQRQRRFHEWFDAFRTLKLVHHLRDNGYPRQDLFESLRQVMEWQAMPVAMESGATLRDAPDKQRDLLAQLRQWRAAGSD